MVNVFGSLGGCVVGESRVDETGIMVDEPEGDGGERK